ncbi:hypothetical protein FGG08_001545 [Glutinoglossum americanum]|uniref:Uncharacterized protein n=1 Tax=Glutinoglossum americanum TaxID=1670608 RepID=A0A9P8IEK5_9PEZI|nr:hypothetical protein FGG08_001545 [Glutinoglossum americanum]
MTLLDTNSVFAETLLLLRTARTPFLEMASKNKRKRRALQREEQRIKRLKEQHATELEELRQSSAATDAELEAFYSRLDGAATRNVEDARHRPTYAPEYIPYDPRLRVQSPGDPIEAGRRSSSHLRLPPPRADDYKLISVYEAIGITEEDLSRDRNERHMEKAEKLTTSYENFRFDEEEIKGGDIGNACYTGSGRFSTPSRILDFSDEDMEVRVRGGDSQGERYTDTTASHENVCSGKEAETIEMVIRDNCARGEGQAEKEDILPAFHQSVRPGEVGMADKDKVTGGDQGEQASGASDLSSMTMGSNRNEELSRSEGAKEGQCAEKGEDDAWWLCHPDDLGSPMDIQ